MRKLLVIGILFMGFIGFSYANPVVSIPDSFGCSGSTVEIPINIDNATGVAGFQFTITFDNNILNATGASEGSLTNGWTISSNTNTPGEIRVGGFSGNPLEGGSGNLCILQFDVVGIAGQTTDLTFTLSELVNLEAQDIPHNSINGSFSITTAPSGGGGGGGCFIATAAYGSYQEKHVWILRQFRDKYLLTNGPGKAFVRWYYRHSPKYASIIAQHPVLRSITRVLLTPLYISAYIVVKNFALPILFFLLGLGSLVALTLRRKIKYKNNYTFRNKIEDKKNWEAFPRDEPLW